MYVGRSRKLGATFPTCVWYFFSAVFSAEKQAYFLFYDQPIGEKLPYVRYFSKPQVRGFGIAGKCLPPENTAEICRQVVAAEKKQPKIIKKYRTYGILKKIQRNSTQKYRTYGKFNVIRKKYRTYGIFCSIGTKKKCPKTAFFGNFGSFSGKILPNISTLINIWGCFLQVDPNFLELPMCTLSGEHVHAS